MAETVTFHQDGDVGIVTLNDPPTNLFGEAFMADLEAAVARLSDSAARAGVILGAGPNFSGGANANIFRGRTAADARAMFERYLPVVHRIEAAPFPVIAGVQGLCLAAGFELALACDLIVAAKGARFSQVEALIGATTFLDGAQRLALRCGAARAREIVYTADIHDARMMADWQIVNRVVPDELVERETLAWARELAAGPTRAHAVTKTMIAALGADGLAVADALILSDSVALFESEDMRAGVERILTKGARNDRYGAKAFSGR